MKKTVALTKCVNLAMCDSTSKLTEDDKEAFLITETGLTYNDETKEYEFSVQNQEFSPETVFMVLNHQYLAFQVYIQTARRMGQEPDIYSTADDIGEYEAIYTGQFAGVKAKEKELGTAISFRYFDEDHPPALSFEIESLCISPKNLATIRFLMKLLKANKKIILAPSTWHIKVVLRWDLKTHQHVFQYEDLPECLQ